MQALGAAAGTPTAAIDALIETVRHLTGTDFAGEGRTLDRLGLGGIGAARIREILEHGFG
jgi:hypothetical protein